MNFTFLPKIGLALACTALIVACGDDGGAKNSTEVSVESYESMKDLPSCTEDLNSKVAKVKDSYYACLSQEWQEIGGLVKGVCHLDVCDDDLDGQYFYVSSPRKLFACNANAWKDLDKNGISESEYVDCVVDALIKETAGDTVDLKKCDAAHQGELASVNKSLYACSNKEWVPVKDQVVSEVDLPDCTADGDYVFVLSKMSAYQCKNGRWSKGGAEVNSSSSIQEASSSSVQEVLPPSSSSEIPTTDDTTKIRGLCMPSVTYAEKGEKISWKFINLGGTPVSMSWDFSENASFPHSTHKVPKISFKRGGLYEAKLVVNEGLPSQSDEIICSKVQVAGDPISGCKCTTNAKMGSASLERPYTGEWTVNGCSGASPFTYEWYNARGSDSVGTGVTTNPGEFAPEVVVTNYDGESMSPVCPAVSVIERVTANCSYEQWSGYRVELITYPRDEFGYPRYHYLDMQVYDSDQRDTMDVEIDPFYATVRVPEIGNSYREYYLTYLGDTVCTMSPITCGAVSDEVPVNKASSWSVNNLSGYNVKSYLWTFTDAEGNEYTSDMASPKNSFGVMGAVKATLVMNGGLSNEKKMSCGTIQVIPSPIYDCSCESVLVSSSDDVAESDPVSYKWTVDGCVTDGGAISYEWGNNLKFTWGDLDIMSTIYEEPVESSSSEDVVESSSSSDEDVESSSSEEETIESSSSSEKEDDSSSSEEIVVESSSSEEPVEESSSSFEEEVESSSSEEEIVESSSSEVVVASSSSEDEPVETDGELGEPPAILRAPTTVSGATAVYEMDSLGYYSPTVVVTNEEGSKSSVVCRDVAVRNTQKLYKIVSLHSETAITLKAGNYVIRDCSSDSWNRYWVIDDYSSRMVNWVKTGSVYGYSRYSIMRVEYPVVLEIPEGESMTISNCKDSLW